MKRGRKRRFHIKKTFYLEKDLYKQLETEPGKTMSDKINLILSMYFNSNIKL